MSRTAQDYLKVWRQWIGKSESNGGFKEIIDLYNSVKPLPLGYQVKYSDEWCDTTVSAAAIKAGMVDLIGRECGCERHIKIFIGKGIWIEDGAITPKVGDIILYNWDQAYQPNDGFADHIGVVESVSAGQITCIEGNKNEMVARRVLSIGNGYIRGFARPVYEAASSTPSSGPSTPNSGNGGINKSVAYYGTVNTAVLNVRTWAGVENPQLKSCPTIKQGTKVGICDVVNAKDGSPWYYILIDGKTYGFVSAAYITRKSSSVSDPTVKDDGVIQKTPIWTGVVTTDALNVRTWAGTNNPRLQSCPLIYSGKEVDVCDVVNAKDGSRWYYIRIDGKIYGFVHSAYIKRK